MKSSSYVKEKALPAIVISGRAFKPRTSIAQWDDCHRKSVSPAAQARAQQQQQQHILLENS
jgi:hypothetical protein